MRCFVIAISVIGGIGILLLLDRLALWMESKGWLYWRKSKGTSTRMGNAFLQLQSMLEPGNRHVIESREEVKEEMNHSGDTNDACRETDNQN